MALSSGTFSVPQRANAVAGVERSPLIVHGTNGAPARVRTVVVRCADGWPGEAVQAASERAATAAAATALAAMRRAQRPTCHLLALSVRVRRGLTQRRRSCRSSQVVVGRRRAAPGGADTERRPRGSSPLGPSEAGYGDGHGELADAARATRGELTMLLQDKVVVVTGGNSGIGAAI